MRQGAVLDQRLRTCSGALKRALATSKFSTATLETLAGHTERELFLSKGFGRTTVAELVSVIHANGLRLKAYGIN